MKTWLFHGVTVGTLLGGGCDPVMESPACPDGNVVAAPEAEAPEAWDALRDAHVQVEVTQSRTAALAGAMLELDVVEISDVEYVEQSPACASDVGHRARAVVDVHTKDGSFSVRVPATVAVAHADQSLHFAFFADEVDLPEDAQLPEPMLAEGTVVAGLALEIASGEVTLLRVDMADSCTDRATCSARDRTPVVSWAQDGPDFDLWFDVLGP